MERKNNTEKSPHLLNSTFLCIFIAFVVFILCNKQECLCKKNKKKELKGKGFYGTAQWFYYFIAIQIIEIAAHFFLVEKKYFRKPVSSLIDENVCEAIKTSIRSPLVGR